MKTQQQHKTKHLAFIQCYHVNTPCFDPGFPTILNFILNYYSGVDTEIRDPRGFTALIKAGLQGRDDCVSALLMHGKFVGHKRFKYFLNHPPGEKHNFSDLLSCNENIQFILKQWGDKIVRYAWVIYGDRVLLQGFIRLTSLFWIAEIMTPSSL